MTKKKLTLKERYKRFRVWQKMPRRFNLKNKEVQKCANCSHEFVGNYCPYCSQKAGLGRVTWKSLRNNVMLLWGMDSSSLLNSIINLLLRPGYFIRDYISGHRQVSFPPLKMLVIVGVFIALMEFLFFPGSAESNEINVGVAIVDNVVEWLHTHNDWATLLVTSFFIWPTWLLFRKAPGYPRHTIPEGFFIQVFMCIIQLIFDFVTRNDSIGTWCLIVYFYIAYRQIFEYKPWGTIWRVALMFISGFVLLVLAATLFAAIGYLITGERTM